MQIQQFRVVSQPKNSVAAKARAKLIIEPILNGQWETAEKLKSRSGYSTIGELLERYQASVGDRANTVRNNSSALRLIVRTVTAGDPDRQSSSDSLTASGWLLPKRSQSGIEREHPFAVMSFKPDQSLHHEKCDFTKN